MPDIVAIEPEGDQDAFLAWCQVLRASASHALGELQAARSPDERRVALRDPARQSVAFASLDGRGAPVGAAWLAMPLHDNRRLGVLELAVHPDHRRHGHGRALLEHAERLHAAAGRDLLVADTQWVAGARDEDDGFVRRFGYEPAQTNLRSSLSLPVERAFLRELMGDHDDGYVLRTAVGGIPQEWVPARAHLAERMSTDVPMGGLQLEEEAWDEERVRQDYERIAAAGRTAVDTFAFARDGSVAGYTQTTITSDPSVVYQQDTLVLREHRGHRLGLRLKAANTLALVEQLEGPARVRTWNAEENAPMLAVNRRLGYAAEAFRREWQKVLR